LLTEVAPRILFGDAVERLIGPAFQGTLVPEQFRPALSPHVRRLLPEDRPGLLALRAACDPDEWSDIDFDPDEPEVFGYFARETLVAAARNMLWAPDAANHGVVTHPAWRGRGCGRAVVSASIQHALDRGRLILYQTLLANTPAVALARSLGVREYARHLAVRLR
jgi:GNAT superfamily N-acetyltransferase